MKTSDLDDAPNPRRDVEALGGSWDVLFHIKELITTDRAQALELARTQPSKALEIFINYGCALGNEQEVFRDLINTLVTVQ